MTAPENNPLLAPGPLPAFHAIKPEHMEPAIDALLGGLKKATARLLDTNQPPSWENTLRPLEDMEDRLNRAWSPVGHLHNVADTEAVRAAYNACLPKITNYATERYQNELLHRTYREIAGSPASMKLGPAERKIIDNALRDFRLSGIDLSPPDRVRFKEMKQRLSQLQTRFEENLLDATQAWKRHVTDESQLDGLPETALALAAQTAAREGKTGWVLTLDLPCYRPVMAYAHDRLLRREIYEAYVTRASELGLHDGRWDNSAIMDDILRLRGEMARLLGFKNFAEYSLATKMAHSTSQVLEFLLDLARRSKPYAERELEELRAFAAGHGGPSSLAAWDVPYYAERLREQRFNLSQEELRPYFPVPVVLQGMFKLVERLYGLHVKAASAETWHPDVRFFTLHEADGAVRGMFYVDLYARPLKRGGAWMDECVSRRRREDGSLQLPVAYLNCNFSPPVEGRPSLLTHDEVLTLFHEFGHGLHHLLTAVDRPSVAGINGVAWDAVELPSQFMENWCWEREVLDWIGRHHQTGKPLDDTLYQRLRASRNFHAGLQMVRQLEFALFDFRLHTEYEPAQGRTTLAILEEVRRQVAVIDAPAFNRFPHGFSHIFAGGYAAGYYSYKWAEVLSADAYARFREEGLFNPVTGRQFLNAILEQGGARDAMELFVAFRGREPRIDALLLEYGMAA
ncbi:MAG TPA: M3 family metallopeptidase [Gammaproteobacteria bacterium]|nr:M3 family metallopeptidase [Gammaproteobacteria bacterium]